MRIIIAIILAFGFFAATAQAPQWSRPGEHPDPHTPSPASGLENTNSNTTQPKPLISNGASYYVTESGDLYFSIPKEYPPMGAPGKDVLLVSYKTSFSGIDRTGVALLETDALRIMAVEGASASPLLDDLIINLRESGVLKGRLDRPKSRYVTILGFSYVRNGKFIFTSQDERWQAANTPRQ